MTDELCTWAWRSETKKSHAHGGSYENSDKFDNSENSGKWVEKMEEKFTLDKHLNAPTMPNINDYRKVVQEAYEEARRIGTLKSLLILPSPENIRTVCLEKLAKEFDRKEIDMLCSFFGEASNIDELTTRVKKHEREKFIPISRFLQRETVKPNITITEMAAWLIDFQLRPFNRFYKTYPLGNTEEQGQKDDFQPRDIETINSDLAKKTEENEIVDIPDTFTQQDDLTKPDVNTNPDIINPSQPDETKPKSKELVFLVIGRRMMRVAAIFFCLFVMTELFKSQQERYTEQVTQLTLPFVPPSTENEPATVKQKAPIKNKTVLKETNKRCQSLTLEGRQCKRNATKGDYCWQHPLK